MAEFERLTDEQLTALVSILNDSPTYLHHRALDELVRRDDEERDANDS